MIEVKSPDLNLNLVALFSKRLTRHGREGTSPHLVVALAITAHELALAAVRTVHCWCQFSHRMTRFFLRFLLCRRFFLREALLISKDSIINLFHRRGGK